jgi:hypothetical protein
MSMICTLTARRLKPGAYDAFRAAWDPGENAEEVIERWRPIYHVRDIKDRDVVISFGFFNGSMEELAEQQARGGRSEQVARIAETVEEVLLDGAYEVVEQLG